MQLEPSHLRRLLHLPATNPLPLHFLYYTHSLKRTKYLPTPISRLHTNDPLCFPYYTQRIKNLRSYLLSVPLPRYCPLPQRCYSSSLDCQPDCQRARLPCYCPLSQRCYSSSLDCQSDCQRARLHRSCPLYCRRSVPDCKFRHWSRHRQTDQHYLYCCD